MAQIEQLFEQVRRFKLPPLAQWHPRESLDIDLRIRADGQWLYRGSAIARLGLVKLFSSILRLEEDGRHYLITPQVKYPVVVEDAPFQAVELRRQGATRAQNLFFRTNVDDVVLADRDHPIRVPTDAVRGQPSPRIEVRDGLQAKICRSVYYELAQLLEPADSDADGGDGHILGVYSAAQFFPFGKIPLCESESGAD